MATEEKIYEEPYPMGSMTTESGEKISLKAVGVSGEAQGIFFTSTITQEYKNETAENLEIIYTFPTGFQTVLLGMDARVGDRELTGVVIEKQEAETKYEEAVSKGDSAIMVQESGNGLFTANLGNIAAGESVVINIRCCQALRYVRGKVRLTIPTVIDDYYGDQRGQGGLQPHEKVVMDAAASYPLSVNLKIMGELARGAISSPTYSIVVEREGEVARVKLGDGATMDRDFVLLMNAPANPSSCLCHKDGDDWIAAASFSPVFPEEANTPIGIKILVDCSGSMGGGRIARAKRGLVKIVSLLDPRDYISYMRFGSSVKHEIRTLSPWDEKTRKIFEKAIADTDANLGGTEMNSALEATFKIGDKKDVPTGVLLITDGDVWDVSAIIESAKRSGHRVFAIGVGEAPRENLLRKLAIETGGACEFVSESENIAEAIARMAQRMRGGIATRIDIDWHEKPSWHSRAPKSVYDGETVTAFATLKEYPAEPPVLKWQIDGVRHESVCSVVEETANESLVRAAMRAKMDDAAGKKEKLKIALDYQLVSPLTSLLLVYERPEDGKLGGTPKVRNVPQQRVRGRIFDRLRSGIAMSMLYSAAEIPCFLRRSCEDVASFAADECFVFDQDDSANLSKAIAEAEKVDQKRKIKDDQFKILTAMWSRMVAEAPMMEEVIDAWLAEIGMSWIKEELEALRAKLNMASEVFYALIVEYADGNFQRLATGDRHSQRLLKKAKAGLPATEEFMFPTQLNTWLES